MKSWRSWFQKKPKVPIFTRERVLTCPIKVEKEGELSSISSDHWEKTFEVEYLSCLAFEDSSAFEWAKKRCQRALKVGELTEEQKWLGIYYAKEITTGYTLKSFLKWIAPEIGFGLFADTDLAPGTYVGEYVGIVRRVCRRKDKKNAYCFEYCVGKDKKSFYAIDAKNQGNLIRWINHSSSPNLIPKAVVSQGLLHIILLASRSIPKGTELTHDYGKQYWAKREKPRDG